MSGFQKVAVIIAATGMLTTLVLPGRQTSSVIKASGTALSGWTKAAQGR